MSIMWTKDGTREVETATFSGRPGFRVHNPQHRTQYPSETGIVLAMYVRREVKGETVTVLAPSTVTALRKLGVELSELVAERPASAYAADEPASMAADGKPITRRPGESVSVWNERKYAEGIGRLLGEIANARRAA